MNYVGYTKNILYETQDDLFPTIFIQESDFGSQVKFAKKISEDHDAYYLISSINPLVVWGGVAGTFVHCPFMILESPEDIVKFVEGLTSDELNNMIEVSTFVRDYSDFYKPQPVTT